MKTAIVFLFAATAVTAFNIEDGCNYIKCETVGVGESVANPFDKCSFCCCKDSTPGSKGKYLQCPNDKTYDPVSKSCRDPICHPANDCEDMTCPSGIHLFPSPKGPEYFCCCLESDTPQTRKCPKGQFDAATESCVGSRKESARMGPDGCMSLVHLCPVPENMGWATIFANPSDRRSYCVCDWGKIHWMPCAPGTSFDDSRKVCV